MTSFLDLDEAVPGFIQINRSRAIAGGIDSCEYDQVTASIESLHEWPARFRAAGHAHYLLGEDAGQAGRRVSAGQAFLAAAAWFHFTTILPSHDRAGHAEAGNAMRRALTYLDPTASVLHGRQFTGILRRPEVAPNPALVVVAPGMDSSKEEFHAVAEALLRRGVATLSIDGPGQGELATRSAPTAHYDLVVSEALDAVQATGLVPSSIGILALSLGGYYAPVSLAREPRLSAGVAVSGPYRLVWDELLPFLVESLALRAGSITAARAFAERIDLTNIAATIEPPLLVVDGGMDVIPGFINGQMLAEQAQRGEYLLIPEGDHLIGNARWKWLPYAADWLTEHLHAPDSF